MKNFSVKFVKRPGPDGIPEKDGFLHTECEYPNLNEENEIIVKTLYLSVDPAQRCQMNEDTGVEYLKPFQIGEVVNGLLGIGVVTESRRDDLKVGDVVVNSISTGGWPWQLYFKTNQFLTAVPTDDPKAELTYYGIPGLTALIGLQEKGYIKDNNGIGKCVVVSGAAGSCGHLAGQFSLAHGCTSVIGICGSDEKCKVLIDQLKFSDAVNYKTENVGEKLCSLCPAGVDVYFDNVGGDVSDAVIANMNKGSHVVLCGQISQYNKTTEYPPPIPESTRDILANKNITRERFLVLAYQEKFMQARQELRSLKEDGKVTVLENVYEGLERSGEAFCDMMRGQNIGKQLVHVSDQ